MSETITFEIPEKDIRAFEKLVDDTLKVLRRMENNSVKREARVSQNLSDTQAIKREIREQMSLLKNKTKKSAAI